MANVKSIRDLWFYSNLAFIINYSITIFRLFVYIPIPYLPSFFNNIFLLVSYSVTILSLVKKVGSSGFTFKKILSNQNFICLGLFIFFVPNILLFPFFLLSIFHVNGDILARKKEFEKLFFFDLCVFLGRNAANIGRMAMICEILLIPVSFVMVLFRRLNILPFLVYCIIVRQQYITNKTMKSVVGEAVMKIDGIFAKMPVEVVAYYDKIKDFIGKYNKGEDEPKKSE